MNFNYKLCNSHVLRRQCVKDLGVLLDRRLYFLEALKCCV
jgi:hypothetical protein